jgi:hypothetical protein
VGGCLATRGVRERLEEIGKLLLHLGDVGGILAALAVAVSAKKALWPQKAVFRVKDCTAGGAGDGCSHRRYSRFG